MKKTIILFLGIIMLSLCGSNSVFSAENNITIQSTGVDLRQLIEVNGDKVIVHGDIIFPEGISIPYDLHVEGNLTVGSNVKLFGNIKVDGNIILGNHVKLYKSLEGKNITTGNYLGAQNIITHGNLSVQGFAHIREGVDVRGDFDSGSDMILQGNSKIRGDVKLGKDVKISGIFYVYGSMNGNYDFLFQGDKFRIVGNFKTQRTSKLIGKIYLFSNTGHRTLFGNRTIRYRYEFINTQYKGIMQQIDPILDYRLSKDEINMIHEDVILFEKRILKQQKIIQQKYHSGQNSIIMDIEIKKMISIQERMFTYLSQYIEKENWDSIQWKILKIQEKTDLKKFVYQYVSGSEFDY